MFGIGRAPAEDRHSGQYRLLREIQSESTWTATTFFIKIRDVSEEKVSPPSLYSLHFRSLVTADFLSLVSRCFQHLYSVLERKLCRFGGQCSDASSIRGHGLEPGIRARVGWLRNNY